MYAWQAPKDASLRRMLKFISRKDRYYANGEECSKPGESSSCGTVR